jgi:TP901 family phage tail tape measure protein
MAWKITLGTLGVKLTLDDSDFTKGMARTRKALGSVDKMIAKGAAAVGAAAVAGIGFAVNEWAKLDQAVMNAAAVSNEGAAAYEKFLSAALKASSGTQFSAVEAGNALQYLSMAGFGAVDAVKALPGVLDLTTAAGIDLGKAADITSDILTGMGMKVEDLGRVNDVLVKTFTSTNTNLEKLGESFQYVASTSAAFEQDIETTAALLGVLANAGRKATTSGRALSTMMVRLVKPMKTTKAAMKALGVSMFDSQGNFRDIIDVIGDLENAQKKMSKAKFAENLARVFGQDALKDVLILLKEGSEKLRDFREELRNSGGTAEDVATLMRSTLANQLKMLQGNIQNLAAKLGQILAPAIEVINGYLTAQVVAISENDNAFADFRDTMVTVLKTTADFIRGAGGVIKILAVIAGVTGKAVRGLQMLSKTYELAKAVKERMEAPGVLIAHDRHKTVERLRKELEELSNESEDTFGWWIEQGDALAGAADDFADVVDKGADAMGNSSRAAVNIKQRLDALAKAMEDAKNSTDNLNKGLGDQEKKADAAYKTLWKLQGILRDFKSDQEAEADKAVASSSKALEEWKKKAKEAKEAVESVHQALFDAVKDNDTEQQKKEIERREKAEQEGEEERKKYIAEMKKRLEESVKGLYQSAIDGFLEISGVLANALSGGERSVLQPLMEGVSAFASNISGVVSGLTRASRGDLSGLASAGQAAASIVQAATAAFLRYATSHEDFQASIGVLRDQVAKLDLDVLGKFFNSFEGAIGVFLAVPELLAPLAHWGSLMDGVIDDYGRTLFDTIKRVAMAFLDFQVVLGELKIIIFNVGKAILGAYISMAKQLNETLGRIFRNFFIDWTGAEGKWMELNNSTENLRDGVDSAREAMDRLKGLTYEEAKASAAKAKEEWKAAEGLKELNSELRNAPSGFKRLAKMRYDAAAAQSSLEQRGVGLSSGGGMSSTQIANTLIAHFHGLTYEEGAKQVLAVAERAKFIRTGSKLTTPAQRHRTALRSGIRQAG